MSWADVKRKYSSGMTSASQSTEDMAARRILRALGLTEQSLPQAETMAGTASERMPDTTLLERAESLYLEYAHAGPRAVVPLPPVRDVRGFREAEDTVLELAEQRKRAVLVFRIRGTDDLQAMGRLNSLLVDTDNLPMPCRLMKSRDGKCVLLCCEAQDYYNNMIRQETKVNG